jgi:hypothetical protein
MALMAHRVISRQRSNRSLSGVERTSRQAIADCATNAQMFGPMRDRMRDGKQRLAQHRHLLFPGVCFRVCAYMRGGGVTWSRVTSLFWVIASLFSRPKFPVRLLRETSAEEAGIPRQPSNADAARARVSQISLYFSLLAGNLGWRPVRYGLRRQPASLVSGGCFPLTRIRATLPRVSQTLRGLFSSIFRILSQHRSISHASLRSPIFNIHYLAAETRFDIA